MGKRVKKRDRVHRHLLHTAEEWRELTGWRRINDNLAMRIRERKPTTAWILPMTDEEIAACGEPLAWVSAPSLTTTGNEVRFIECNPDGSVKDGAAVHDGTGALIGKASRTGECGVYAVDSETAFLYTADEPTTYTVDLPMQRLRIETTDPESIASIRRIDVDCEEGPYGRDSVGYYVNRHG